MRKSRRKQNTEKLTKQLQFLMCATRMERKFFNARVKEHPDLKSYGAQSFVIGDIRFYIPATRTVMHEDGYTPIFLFFSQDLDNKKLSDIYDHFDIVYSSQIFDQKDWGEVKLDDHDLNKVYQTFKYVVAAFGRYASYPVEAITAVEGFEEVGVFSSYPFEKLSEEYSLRGYVTREQAMPVSTSSNFVAPTFDMKNSKSSQTFHMNIFTRAGREVELRSDDIKMRIRVKSDLSSIYWEETLSLESTIEVDHEGDDLPDFLAIMKFVVNYLIVFPNEPVTFFAPSPVECHEQTFMNSRFF